LGTSKDLTVYSFINARMGKEPAVRGIRLEWSGRVDLLALSLPKETTGLLVPNQMQKIVELCGIL
jgi:hypothetical protein